MTIDNSLNFNMKVLPSTGLHPGHACDLNPSEQLAKVHKFVTSKPKTVQEIPFNQFNIFSGIFLLNHFLYKFLG